MVEVQPHHLAHGDLWVNLLGLAMQPKHLYGFVFLKRIKMQAILTSLVNPRWANAEHTLIDCEITTSQFGDDVLPFTASQNDCEAHGRAIFADIVSGKYGDIAEFA